MVLEWFKLPESDATALPSYVYTTGTSYAYLNWLTLA